MVAYLEKPEESFLWVLKMVDGEVTFKLMDDHPEYILCRISDVSKSYIIGPKQYEYLKDLFSDLYLPLAYFKSSLAEVLHLKDEF